MPIPRQSIADNSTYFQVVPSQKRKARRNSAAHDLSEVVVQEHLRHERINSVHSELRQIFSSSQMREAVEREQSIHVHRNAIQQVHDEMRRKSNVKNIKSLLNKEVECERRRRIFIMESSLENPGSFLSRCMEQTNNMLSYVHDNLKELFKKRESVRQSQIRKEKLKFEESKETMLQEFRRRVASQQVSMGADRNRMEYLHSYVHRLSNQDFCQADARLIEVQEELIKLQNKNEGARLQKERSEIEMAKQRKSLVEEDLLRRHNRIKARRLYEIQRKSSQVTIDLTKQPNQQDEMRRRKLSTVHSELMSKNARKE